MKNPFRKFKTFDYILWISSVLTVTVSYILGGNGDAFAIIASIIGVSALIFVAKGQVLGQLLIILFAILYALVSLKQSYYGEMITYLGMSAPMAVASLISWLKNPFNSGDEVAVATPKRSTVLYVILCTVPITIAFYFVLKALNNANLLFSTLSVTTSFLAASLTFLRSPYYALAYAANDIILIVLWVLAALKDPSCTAMIACFAAFLANDIHGFLSWKKMQRMQKYMLNDNYD